MALGFSACGIAAAEAVDPATQALFLQWIGDGSYADMGYMANHIDKRLDPRLLMPEVKSIICVALNYAPLRRIPEGEPQLAVYAYGNDYHDVMKEKLHLLAERIGATTYRAFCDTAPILERHWAVMAGLGWIGKSHLLIVPQGGSQFFLGELFVDFECEYDQPQPSRCGNCRRCVDACPTQALSMDEGGTTHFDARRCLSYLTIENRGPLPEGTDEKMGHCIYGCDRCQEACPWNRYARPTDEARLQPSDELLSMTAERWRNLSVEEYRRLFKGSAVKRAKYEGLMRNVREMLNYKKKIAGKRN